MRLWPILQGLCLVLTANGAPVLAKAFLQEWGAQPLDLGCAFLDGKPLFGKSKTIRGVLAALLAATLTAPLLGLNWDVGLLAGAAAMAGDLFSSFVKRRFGLPPQAMAPGLDQAPESLLPLLACKGALGISTAEAAIGASLFWIGELILSRAAFAMGIRDRPY
ncbi:CDP-archaeol synthase [Methylocapsa acidiphila]|uniref:CDP-archaeol synthase n=1 Tax=Methylocapsa acidiphila TaxID=133552 RepID=UPI0004189E38|nr:CDP-archaeol synthase [Methylocapsa acidiphila]